MAFIYGDRVKETSLTVGTGPITLGGATAGFVTFDTGVGLGNECFYGIFNTIDDTWEMGRGTVGAGTLTRDTVFSSSGPPTPGALVNFAVGDKIVYTTVPETFYAGALDSASHALVDHTVGPLNLLDATAHAAIDHTAAPLNLLTSPAHELVDHTVAPFNLMDVTAHEAVDHLIAPFNLLDATAHGLVNHTLGPLFLHDTASHALIDHVTVLNNNPAQVTIPERTAGIEAALRSFAPADISAMAGIFGGGGGAGLQVATFAPTTFAWSASAAGIATPPIGFTPVVAFAFGSFHHSFGSTTPNDNSSLAVGVATSGSSYAHGQNTEASSDGNDMVTTYASGSISGFSNLNGAYKSAFDLATVNVGWGIPAADQITLTPSTTITGNLTLIVLG